MSGSEHIPVLCAEAVSHLLGESVEPSQRRHGIYVDGTFGRGGHARALLHELDESSVLFVMDRDPAAVAAAQQLASEDTRVRVIDECFSTMAAQLAARNVASVSGILLDLGVSSPQLDVAERGFSLRTDGPLDMRMTPTGSTAAQWLNSAEAAEITRVLRDYGEERFARRIASRIVASRPLATTMELAEVVAAAVPKGVSKPPGRHDATKVFQAVRIHINDELGELERVLPQAFELLALGGRLAVISFHSLEDRRVKRFMRNLVQPPSPPRRLPLRADQLPQAQARAIVGPYRAQSTELRHNPRARSAVLRVIERTVEHVA